MNKIITITLMSMGLLGTIGMILINHYNANADGNADYLTSANPIKLNQLFFAGKEEIDDHSTPNNGSEAEIYQT